MSNPNPEAGDTQRFIAEPTPVFDRRGSPREKVYLTGLLVFDAGDTAPCIIVDRSKSGFRIKLLEARDMPESFGLIDLVAGMGYEGRTVWRDGVLAGSMALASYDLRAPQSSLGLRLQTAWRTALA